MDVTNSPKVSGFAIPVEGLTTAEDKLNPHRWFQHMRKTSPVRYDERRECWDLFRYDDILQVLKDPATFSSVRTVTGPVLLGSIIGMDPPKHNQMRSIVSKAFTPKSIAELDTRIADITRDLLKAIQGRQQIDLIKEISYPLPVIVIAELLGVPSEDRRLFKDWSDIVVKMPKDNQAPSVHMFIEERTKARQELDDYFTKIIAQRRKNPQADLITKLVQAEVDNQRLRDDEIIEFCILLLAAGNETTTNLITNAIRLCIEKTDVQTHLRNQPEMIEGAIEEVLRFYSPVLAMNRFTTKDVEIGGKQLKQGDQVITWIASANRDETRFSQADQFIVERSPNQHLAFGHGIHFCLGAPLARLEAKVSLPLILEQFHDITFPMGTQLQPIPSTFVYGVKELPIQYSQLDN